MKSFKRAIPFLLLNVILSAATALVILNWWGGGLRTSLNVPTLPAAPTSSAALLTASAQDQATPLPTMPAATASGDASGRVIEIQEVIGPGDLDNETVLLHRLGDGDLRLTGWKLDDNGGHSFVFPEFVLNKDGAVQVATRPGTNTAIALYWGLQEAIWTTGKMVALYDTQGNLQASFTVK